MEFGEYENEECAKANEVVKQLLEEYDGDKIQISTSVIFHLQKFTSVV